MARDDDTVVWFNEAELDGGTTVVGAVDEPTDEELDREIDAMFAGVVEGAAAVTAGDGFRASAQDRMPGAPSEGQDDESCPRIAFDQARQMYVIPLADPIVFVEKVRRHYQLLAIADDRPAEIVQLMQTEFFRPGITSELTEASTLSLFLAAASYRMTPLQTAETAINQDLATAFQARAAATNRKDQL